MSPHRLLPAALVGLALAACSSVTGTYPRSGAVVPAAAVRLTENYAVSLEKLVGYAGVAAAAYAVLDPLAPNWQIHEADLGEAHYLLVLRMKRVHAGGDGEARQVFQRRAAQLARAGGYGGFEIVSYSEGIESTLPAQRVGEGVIRLVAPGASAPMALAPAR